MFNVHVAPNEIMQLPHYEDISQTILIYNLLIL